jgi:hypothetical protein
MRLIAIEGLQTHLFAFQTPHPSDFFRWPKFSKNMEGIVSIAGRLATAP